MIQALHKALFLKMAALKNRLQHKMDRTSMPTMLSVKALSEFDFLSCFNIEDVAACLLQNDYQRAKKALLHHYGRRVESDWLKPPDTITDLRINISTLESQDLVGIADSALKYEFSPDGKQPIVNADGNIEWCVNPVQTPEWLWRLNRHQWWPVLGLAYQATGAARYAEAFVCQMLDWIESNPPPKKKAETSPTWRLMEVGMRLRISWIPCFGLFYRAPVFSSKAKLKMLRAMVDHARFLSLFKTQHNHLLRETNGLAYFSVYFSEFRESEKWKQLALMRFEDELVKQINQDGSHVELSTGYQLLVIDEFDQMLRLLNKHNLSLPNENLSVWLGAMYDMLAYIIKPDFTFPEINDGFLRWGNRQLSRAAKLLRRPDLLYIGTSGKKGVPPKKTSAALKNAGLYIMRSDWGKDARYLLFDAGPYGGWHGHEDKLSIEVFANGQSFIIDSGSYTYDELDPFRKYFVGTYGHNTVLVDARSQVRRWHKENMIARPTPEQDAVWITHPEFDYAKGFYCDGYGDLVFPKPHKPIIINDVTHIRRILFVKPYYWLVVDEMQSKKPHSYQFLFHVPPVINIIPRAENRIVMRNKETGRGLVMLSIGSQNIKFSLLNGCEMPIQGWISEGHQRKSPSSVLICEMEGDGSTLLSTLLYPDSSNLEDDHLSIAPVDVRAGSGFAYIVSNPSGKDYLMLSDNDDKKSFGPYHSSSMVAGIRTDHHGQVLAQFECDNEK